MEKKTFEEWLSYIENKGIEISKQVTDRMVQKNGSWQSLIILARLLSSENYEEYEGSSEISLEIMEETLNNYMEGYFDKDNLVPEEKYLEQKVWVLQDIGLLQWKVNQDAQKALEYLNKAWALLEATEFDFVFLVKGYVWKHRLDFLKIVGQKDKALEETAKVISYYENITKFENNSYLYNAYLFKAEIEKEDNNLEQSLDYLKQALNFFPLAEDQEKDLEEIWPKRKEDYLGTFEKMEKLTHRRVEWDI
ncbi:hypothetical protein SAMN00017405_1989 [Desulfonispora thiosulfatigenes DSM 11270]|uniref:Tetratricopeptide repeat-containing protein n=1 Tax=Desulfonispora thiosulfatigenes DSM 11270 TaxID=656914 RepID=A0A1W1UI38_DESTI|nr:hypothetical protein [Desulfonispora thiosulfatigenes]SMB80775.1 hypothetical protein SAMN00017405_1989 [Desulfonispora thiosulfatigenes DSM 11270]